MNSEPVSPTAFPGETDTILVAGVMRTGQTWLCFMLAHALNARFLEPYCLLRGIVYSGNAYVRSLTGGGLPGREPTTYRLVVKTHEQPDPHHSLTRKVVLIIRDPRDIATSAALRYRVMTTTGSDVEEDAQQLSMLHAPLRKPATLKNRVWMLIHRSRLLGVLLTARKWRAFHETWLQVPFCHVVKFEDLVQDPARELRRLCTYLGVEPGEEQLRATAHLLSMKEINRHHSDTAPENRIGFRKGIVGDFRNHLSRLELAIIRHYCGKAAARFGYTL